MKKRIISRYRMRRVVTRTARLPIALMVFAASVLMLHSSDNVQAGSVSNKTTAPLINSTLDLSVVTSPNTGAIVSEPSDHADQAVSFATQTEQEGIGNKRANLRNTSRTIATAGVLLIPLDSRIVRTVPTPDSGEKADGFTEITSSLGNGKNLLAGLGFLRLLGNEYDKETANLALRAMANAGIATQSLKVLTGRERPRESDDAGQFRGPTVTRHDSFPSGHTSLAFAVATVLAARYPEQRSWHYGLAAAVGWARIRLSAHFPSDVLVGAALGIQAGNNAIHDRPGYLTFRF